MEIMNMMLQRNVYQSGQGSKLRQSSSTSFEDMMSKAGEKPAMRKNSSARDTSPRSESGVQVQNLDRKVEVADREANRNGEKSKTDLKGSEKSLLEKLEELEKSISSGDSAQVEEAFAELLSFLGIQLSGAELENFNIGELKVQVEELFAKLEGLISGEDQGVELSKLDLENIKSGLEMVKELMEPMKNIQKSEFEELNAKLESLNSKLEEVIKAKDLELDSDGNLKNTGKDTKDIDGLKNSAGKEHVEGEGGVTESLAEEVLVEESVLEKSDKSKNVEEPMEVEQPRENSVKLEFEKIVLSQNMKSEMNHNMHTVINKEVNVEQNYLNMDKLDIIKQISAKMKLNGGDTVNEIKMKLTPESLGELTIKVTLERGIISARAIVENPYVKQIMESNMAELRQNLKSQGINFDEIEVFVGEDPREQNQTRENYFGQDSNRKKKRSISGIEELELEEAGKILEEEILSSERVNTTV